MFPSPSWARRWSSPFTTTTTWLPSWRGWRSGHRERYQRGPPYWSRQLVRGGSPADLLCVCASRSLSPPTNPPPHRRLTSPWSTEWEGQSQHSRLNVCGRRRRLLCRDVPLKKTVDSKLFSADISQRDVAFVWVTLSMIQGINSLFLEVLPPLLICVQVNPASV